MRKILGLPSSTTGNFSQILRQQLLWMLLLRIVLYTLLLGVTYILSGLEFSIIILPSSTLILLLLSVYTITIASALMLRREINLQGFGFFQCILDTVFASALVYLTGISNSIFTSVYFFSIITGGLILPRRGGLIAAAAATLCYGLILFLEFRGIVPAYFMVFDVSPMQKLPELVNLFAVKGLTFFLAALLSAMFGMRLHSTEAVLSDTIYSFDKLSHLYKTIFDNISTGIITTNDQNIITSANTAARKIIDYPLEELVGNDVLSVFPHLNLRSRDTRQATDFAKKDGTRIRIGYSLTSLHLPSKVSGKPSSNCEEDSKLITLQDISEIEKLENAIRQGEKLAAIGMMSAGIAHDFRNPLTAISGSAQILANEFSTAGDKNDENLMLTNIILRESNRLISTIADFLKFARPDLVERYWFSLINCVEEVLQVCRADPEWPETVTVRVDIDRRTDIWADEKQFFTIMNHLIQNGIAFCPEGREFIRIQAREQSISDEKENLVISVEDNGPGIEKDMYDRIFEPFYTNRADGTGLGLTIVQQIVEGHRGSISVSPSSLGGAKFTVTLPLY